MSYYSINSLENEENEYVSKNDLLVLKQIITNKIDNIENKIDNLLFSINSLMKYNHKIEEQIQCVFKKINEISTKERIKFIESNNDHYLPEKIFKDDNQISENKVKLSNNIDKEVLYDENNNDKIINTNKETIKDIKKESKLNNYRSLISSNIKLSKSPGRTKNRSTERQRFVSDNKEVLSKDKINLSENSEDKQLIPLVNSEDISINLLNSNTDKKLKDNNDNNLSLIKENSKVIINEHSEYCINQSIDNNDKRKKVEKNFKNIERYKDIKKELFNLDKEFIKKCLDDACIESDFKIFKKIYIDNVPKEYYPIRSFRKKLQYWLNGHMIDDCSGNYIKDTIINNIENCYININKYEEYEDDPEQFIRNQEYITKMNEQKYKDKMLSMIIDIIKI
jgi:hypothetical protein